MALQNFIKSCFDRVVASDYDGPTSAHPIIVLNSLKNIIGDDRQNPSKLLLDAMAGLVERFPQRNDDQAVLDRVAKDGLGLTVFIADLEDVCQCGNPLEIETEAARLQWVSENGLAGIDCLIEVALQDFDRLGLFAYHLQRANVFNQDVKNTWPHTRCLLKEIAKSPLPDPHDRIEINIDDYFSPLASCLSSLIPSLSAAKRLWGGNYVRIEGYRRELSHWFSTMSVEESLAKNMMNGLEDYVKNGGKFFIGMAENFIGNPEWEAKIIQLEALRYFAKNVSSNDLPIISSYLKELTS